MDKGILGWLRQGRVEVVCGIIWFSLVLVFVYVTWALISERVGSENAGVVRLICCLHWFPWTSNSHWCLRAECCIANALDSHVGTDIDCMVGI